MKQNIINNQNKKIDDLTTQTKHNDAAINTLTKDLGSLKHILIMKSHEN
jgi:hypothetical protein